MGLIFIWKKMSFPLLPTQEEGHDSGQESWSSKLRRIDFFGAISLGLANCSLLLFLDELQQSLNILQSLAAILLLSTWIGFMIVFIAVEAFWAREPILPLRLLAERNVFSSYAIQLLQAAAQVSVCPSQDFYYCCPVNLVSAVLHICASLFQGYHSRLGHRGGDKASTYQSGNHHWRFGQRFCNQAASLPFHPCSRATTDEF